MRKLAPLRATRSVFSKVGTLPNVLLITIQPLFAVAEDSKVSADPFPFTDIHVREETAASCTTTFVEEVDAKRCTFGCRIMGELTSFGGVGTRVLKEIPANGNLGRVMLVHACEPAVASTCGSKPRTRLID